MIAQTQLRHTFRPCVSAQRPSRAGRSVVAPAIRCEFAEGAKVRVKDSVMIYHVGKFKTGLDLQGMEGVVQADVRNFKGMELSATMPWKVQFEAPAPDGSDKPVCVAETVTRLYA